MDTVICENIYVSVNEAERSQSFNDIWQTVVNLTLNK